MSSNNVGQLITKTVTTLQHFATLQHTSPSYTSLHLSTLHFLSFTLHYPLIWFHPFTIPTVLFHLTSLNQTGCVGAPSALTAFNGFPQSLQAYSRIVPILDGPYRDWATGWKDQSSQWRTQEFCSGGRGSTNSVEDR